VNETKYNTYVKRELAYQTAMMSTRTTTAICIARLLQTPAWLSRPPPPRYSSQSLHAAVPLRPRLCCCCCCWWWWWWWRPQRLHRCCSLWRFVGRRPRLMLVESAALEFELELGDDFVPFALSSVLRVQSRQTRCFYNKLWRYQRRCRYQRHKYKPK